MPEMKQCHICGEEINQIAKRCPHCQTWLRKWGIDPSDPKFVIWWIVIVTVIVTAIVATGIFKSEDKKFQDYASSLIITESKLHYSYEECCSSISVLGKIKNESAIPWEDIHFEVQFYDSENKLIDTFSERPWKLIVLPHSESTFRVRDKADKNEEAYASYNIIIKKASESDDWF